MHKLHCESVVDDVALVCTGLYFFEAPSFPIQERDSKGILRRY